MIRSGSETEQMGQQPPKSQKNKLYLQIMKKLNRLRAMSVPELCFRFARYFRDKRDKQRVLRGDVDSLALFIAKLNGQADSLEDKFRVIYTAFHNRRPFRWQKKPREQFVDLYRTHFVKNLNLCAKAAERYIKGEFTIFGLPVHFAESIDWHYDPLLKKAIPLVYWRDIDYYSEKIKEVKYIWELNRCQHFVTFAKLFYLTGSEKYARALFDQWTDWIKKNPYKMGINWASSLECAFRIISWTWSLFFVRESQQLNPGLYAHVLQSIHLHAQFIEGHLSKYSSANNHLIGEALGLIYAGSYFPELAKAETWRNLGFAIVFDELLSQVHSDGVCKEQTTFYQKYIYDFGILMLLAAHYACVSVPPEVRVRLEKMAEFYVALMDQNGYIPNIGDDDGGETLRLVEGEKNRYLSALSTAAVLFSNTNCRKVCTELSEATLWLLGESAIGTFSQLRAKKENRFFIHFKSGGYIVMNQDKPVPQKLIFDCGPLGLAPMAAHGHADALSFTLSVDGTPVLIDSGTYLYLGAGQDRDYFRSTAAHNTLTVDDRSQSESLGPFQWGQRAECTVEEIIDDGKILRVQASHNGFRRQKLTHHRTIEARDGMWYCLDLISGVGNHKIDMYFHCAPCETSRQNQSVSALFPAFTAELTFHQSDSACREDIHIFTAWHSKSFGQREQHQVIQRQVIANLPLKLVTSIKVNV
ncbi:alginate lyase family protein [candidate division KSB1 bacterium]|nr:alginate lyase family protein [candidate division KSB1 bacterium]